MFSGNRRSIFVAIVWTIIAVNFVYFFRRSLMSDYCNIDQLLKRTSPALTSSSAATSTGVVVGVGSEIIVDATRNSAATEMKAEDDEKDEEFGGCETEFNIDKSRSTHVQQPTWCMYKNEVDLRIIVLTYNRHASLLKLLNSINDLELDGDSVAVEIWIDRSRQTNAVDEQTVSAALSFQWRHGPVGVHIRRRHAGIYGQWINTWRPRSPSTAEIALILEDDLSLSPYAYRWLRAARRFYVDRRDDVAGVTLQSEGLIVAANGASLVRPSAVDGPAFLYALMGSWGFAPTPSVWIAFQDWYRHVRSKPGYSPLVPGLIMSTWYKNFERQGKADSMWTMWFLHYCAKVRKLYTVYNNVPVVAKQLNLLTESNRAYLAVNRREPGLHFSGQAANNTNQLLTIWNDEFIKFHNNPPVLGFDGKHVETRDPSAAVAR